MSSHEPPIGSAPGGAGDHPALVEIRPGASVLFPQDDGSGHVVWTRIDVLSGGTMLATFFQQRPGGNTAEEEGMAQVIVTHEGTERGGRLCVSLWDESDHCCSDEPSHEQMLIEDTVGEPANRYLRGDGGGSCALCPARPNIASDGREITAAEFATMIERGQVSPTGGTGFAVQERSQPL